jgi:hypothetical protein
MPGLDNQEAENNLKELLKVCIQSQGVEIIENFHRMA